MELVPISFHKIMQARTYTVIMLGTEDKKFAIYTDPLVGKTLQNLLTGKPHPRPYTHDLMQSIFLGLEIRLKQVVINRIEDTIYFSRLFLEQQLGDQKMILEIDARPSDCLTLALMHNAPVYCRKEVFETAVPIEE
jgi:uncharacterized protein